MIKTEKEYKEAKKRLKEELQSIEQCRLKMEQLGIPCNQIELATDPLESLALQLKEYIEEYEKELL